MRRLSLRSRLTLALAGAAVLPVLAFGLLVLLVLDQAVGDRQSDALTAEARLAAAEVGASLDSGAADHLAALTGASVTFFDARGQVLASSGPGAATVPPPGPQASGGSPSGTAGAGGVVIRRTAGGQVVAYAPIGGAAGVFMLAVSQPAATGPALLAPLLAILVATLLIAAFLSLGLGRSLFRPLSQLSETLDRLQAGDLQVQVPVESDDELGRLMASHNRLAAALAARNRSLAVVSQAFTPLSPKAGVAPFLSAAEQAARQAFGFTAVQVRLGPPPSGAEAAERVPGEAFEVTAPLAVGDDPLGTLSGTLPPTRDWGDADQDLLRVLGVQLAGAIRNAELFHTTAELAELKNEFLRGVSHNLQTPLTSIRAFAGQMAAENGDRRLGIIVEQTERLSRLVAQLLTVTKIEAGTLKPQVDVFPMAALVQRAWESLNHPGQPLALDDRASGWLAAADRDWVEQVVWALLDNAIKYGGGGPIDVTIAPDGETVARIVTTVRDHGPGIAPVDRERVFERFTRLAPSSSDGSGLGLSVARGLLQAMGGHLWLAEAEGSGAAFAFSLPAERIGEP